MAKSNVIALIEELNLLRSLLHSDDYLQIRPSGDFEQVCLKLDYDIQITFFIDSVHTLTINNLHDLHINRSSNKCSLKHEQWISIQNYFNELIQQSKSTTSLYSIILTIQNYISQISTQTSKSRTTISISKGDASTPIQKFRGADLIFNRILYDKSIDRSQVMIGYEDRFTGIHEIAFNDFKKVHEDEYGIPMHRVRYYKINGRIVWDRIKKFDILTSSETPNEATNDAEQTTNLVEGLYRFEKTTHQWILSPRTSLIADNLQHPSISDMCIPERCQFLTWNILFDYYKSEFIYTNQRYEVILHTLKSFLPDLICLQEVTMKFLDLLLNEIWLGENNYYIIIMGSTLVSNQEQSYGQIMLMKNFQPRAFSICPLNSFDDSRITGKKEFIVARFGLNASITIDLVNLHLHSNHSYKSDEKRCQSLEFFFQTMKTQNYMLIGDFNFSDYDIKEQNLLQRYQHQVHDLWKDIYDLDENPGFTFDPSRNFCAQITSDFPVSLRLDRYLLHTLPNLYYSIEHLNMVGLETIPIDRSNNKRINQSDHYALQLIIHFQIRTISHHSALVILPPMDTWPCIQSFREQYDPLMNQWPPHIKLLWPFCDLTDTEDDEENILLPLRLLLSQHQSFDIEMNEIDSSNENHSSFMKLNEQSRKYVEQLHEHIEQIFPQCSMNNGNIYNPHMTIAQFLSNKRQNQVKSTLTLTKSIQFPVRYVYILQRSNDDDTRPFHIAYQLPLSSILEPIGLNQFNCVGSDLEAFFHQMNLYESKKSYEQKREKFDRLSSCFEQIFYKDTSHCFTHAFFPYGSFRLGLNGEDVDTVFILSEEKCLNHKTNFDQTLLQLRYDLSALNTHIINLLETRIQTDLSNEITHCRIIQALFPIISILFNDQTRVEIFVQIKMKSISNEEHKQTSERINLLMNFHEPIHGVHDMERLIAYVRSPPIFQHLLTFIRIWAQNVGLYGQVYGYIGGYSWAILCAYICHSFLSPINSLSSIEHFSLEQFFTLVKKFFSVYSHFNWSSKPLRLHSKSYKQIYYSDEPSIHNRGSMQILCPSPPFNNTSRSTINSTRRLIIEGFQDVLQLINIPKTDEDCLKEIVQLPNKFPHETIQSILQLTLSSQTIGELNQWIGYMKSRLAHFLTDCEDECDLYVQTQNFLECREKSLERFYSIGFQLNEQVLSRHREFYYSLNRFLDQFKLCSFRTETMKISYKLMSIHDWKIECMQAKEQRNN